MKAHKGRGCKPPLFLDLDIYMEMGYGSENDLIPVGNRTLAVNPITSHFADKCVKNSGTSWWCRRTWRSGAIAANRLRTTETISKRFLYQNFLFISLVLLLISISNCLA
jgi:hypothetical protein